MRRSEHSYNEDREETLMDEITDKCDAIVVAANVFGQKERWWIAGRLKYAITLSANGYLGSNDIRLAVSTANITDIRAVYDALMVKV